MRRSHKKIPSALPRLSDTASGSKRFVLQDVGEKHDRLLVSSASRTRRSFAGLTMNRAFAAVLFGLFVIMLLLSFLVGINVYQALDTLAASESTQRLEQSFLANTVHSNDTSGAVRVGEGPEGKALVLSETVDGTNAYETRIYAHDGSIVQEYALAGSPYAPEKAIVLFDSQQFDFTFEKGLLTIVTDTGSVDVALRSAEGSRS